MQLPYDSDNKLLAMLDSIEQTVFRNGAYYSEVTGVQKELLNALDVPLPTPEPYGKVAKEEEEVDEDDEEESVEDDEKEEKKSRFWSRSKKDESEDEGSSEGSGGLFSFVREKPFLKKMWKTYCGNWKWVF